MKSKVDLTQQVFVSNKSMEEMIFTYADHVMNCFGNCTRNFVIHFYLRMNQTKKEQLGAEFRWKDDEI